jgi:hypothetical protein
MKRGWLKLVLIAFLVFSAFLHVLIQFTEKISASPGLEDNLDSGLVLYLKFDNQSSYGENDSFVHDFSGKNNNGFVNSAKWNSSAGISGGAFEFDGADDYLSITDSDVLSPNSKGQLTISFWMKPATFNFVGTSTDADSKSRIHPINKYAYSGQNAEWYFAFYNGTGNDGSENRPKRISFYVCNKTGGKCIGSYFQDDLKLNKWIFIVGVVNGTHTFIYKNGSLRDSDHLSKYGIIMENRGAPLRLGGLVNGGMFKGVIDELRVYNRTLNSNEIAALYRLNLSQSTVNSTNNVINITNVTSNVNNNITNTTNNITNEEIQEENSGSSGGGEGVIKKIIKKDTTNSSNNQTINQASLSEENNSLNSNNNSSDEPITGRATFEENDISGKKSYSLLDSYFYQGLVTVVGILGIVLIIHILFLRKDNDEDEEYNYHEI